MARKMTSQEWLDGENLKVNPDCEDCQRLASQIAKLSLVVKAIAGEAPDNVRGEKVRV